MDPGYPLQVNRCGFGEPADAVIITYGGLTHLAMDAAKRLFEDFEWRVHVVVCTQLAPLPIHDLVGVTERCGNIVTLEEGTKRCGWGAEVAAALLEETGSDIRLKRCAALDSIIPSCAAGEETVLPQMDDVIGAVRSLLQ